MDIDEWDEFRFSCHGRFFRVRLWRVVWTLNERDVFRFSCHGRSFRVRSLWYIISSVADERYHY